MARNECKILEDKCKEKIINANHLEDEMVDCFYEIKKHKNWIKTIENRFKVIYNNDSESDMSNDS